MHLSLGNLQKASNVQKNPSLLTATKISTVIVSVSGPGISPPINFHWDDHSDASVAPTDIQMDVPQGSARLVQVLLVYSGDSTQSFYYGDSTQDLSGPQTDVTITTAQMGTSTIEGHVYGRWMDGSTAGGPTGILQAFVQPPNGKPAMNVMNTTMFAGWFNLFLLDTANFTYTLNGNPIFQNVNLASAIFAPSAKVLRVSSPPFDRINNGNTETSLAQNYVFGFFGPSVPAANMACYSSNPVTISGLYQVGSTTTLLNWNPASPSATTTVGVQGGGTGYVALDGSDCSTTITNFRTHINFDPANMRNGNDSVGGFHGPFRQLTNGNYIDLSVSGTNTSLSWDLLPGSNQTGAVAGVSAFARPAPSVQDNSIYADAGVACSRIAKFGFQQVGDDVATATSTTAGSLTIANLPANSQLVLCPFVLAGGTRVYPDAGQEVYMSMGGGPRPAVTVTLQPLPGMSSSKVVQNACLPLMVQGLDSSGNPTQLPNGITSAFDSNNNGLHMSSDCSDSTVASTPTSIWSGGLVYYKTSGTPGTSVSISLPTLANAGGVSVSQVLSMTIVVAPTPVMVSAIVPSTMPFVPNGCYEVIYVVSGLSGTDLVAVPATPYTSIYPPSSPSSLQFFNSPSCSMSAGGMYTATAGFGTFTNYFKSTALGTVSLNTSGSIAANANMGSVSFVSAGAPVSLALSTPNFVNALTCNPIQISLTDSNGNPSPAVGVVTAAVSSSGITLYSSSTCTSGSLGSSTTAGFTNGSSTFTGPLYYAATSAGTATLQVSAPGLNSLSQTINVAEAVATTLQIVMPGQTSGATVTGAPSAQAEYSTFTIKAYALRSDGTLDTNYSGTASLTQPGFSVTAPTLAFTNGVANIQTTTTLPGIYSSLYVSAMPGSITGFSTGALFVEPSATNLNIYNYDGAPSGSCIPLMVGLLDHSIQTSPTSLYYFPAPAPAALITTLSGVSSGGNFYGNDPTCTSQSSNLTISAGERAGIIYMKQGASVSTSVVASASGMTGSSGSYVPLAPGATSGGGPFLEFSGPGFLKVGVCSPYMLTFVDTNHLPISIASTSTLAFGALPSNASVYTDGACTNNITTLPLSTGDRAKLFYLKATSSAGGGIINATLSGYSDVSNLFINVYN